MIDERYIVPNSSNIESFAYSPTRSVLTIEFKGGATWEYDQVERQLFEDMKLAESKGSFFQSRVRKAYIGRRIK